MKVAYRDKSLRLATRRLPENVVSSKGVVAAPVLADFLKQLRQDEQIKAKDCSLIVSDQESYFRHVTLPAMTVSELTLNLPFEFRDYISDDLEAYVFDYAVDKMVMGDDGKPERMELYAAAARKDVVQSYADVLRRAGFRLRVVTPSLMAFMGLLHHYNIVHPEDQGRTVVVVNIGYNRMGISFYEGDRLESSRMVEAGCYDVDTAIAEVKGVDLHVAGSYRDSNFEEVLDTEAVRAVFDRMVFELTKVINFYNFSHPDKEIKNIYLAGGGAAIPQLVTALEAGFEYPVSFISSLMPEELHGNPDANVCALAFSALMAGEEASHGA